MKINKIVVMAALLGNLAQAGEKRGFTEREITVCVKSVIQESGLAQVIAGQMFAGIGLKIKWQDESTCQDGGEGIIHLRYDTGIPNERYPGALAFAMPYEGVHVCVFIDRIRKSVNPKTVPFLLAHVLVHEITHILQGVNRHSSTGIMKAAWSHKDHQQMRCKPLAFTPLDIALIHLGLESWPSRIMASLNR
jgi:hypothetical protein